MQISKQEFNHMKENIYLNIKTYRKTSGGWTIETIGDTMDMYFRGINVNTIWLERISLENLNNEIEETIQNIERTLKF